MFVTQNTDLLKQNTHYEGVAFIYLEVYFNWCCRELFVFNAI